jgi:protein-tyrosine phosphatase
MRTTVFWIDGPWRGKLAIVARPRGGDWLESEVQDWKETGIQVVVSALTNEERAELDLDQEAVLCESAGQEFLAFPIDDRAVPTSAPATADLVHRLEDKLNEGKNVAIHCRQGVGRSALLAACVLAAAGMDTEAAFARIEASRGCVVPDTAEQREWVARFARDLVTAAPR